jgi:hypothetical protein
MTTASLRSDWSPAQEISTAPRLRLLARSGPAERARAERDEPGAPAVTHNRNGAAAAPDARHAGASSPAPVLVAGADAATRASVRRELGELMPQGTRFEEVGTFWELLARAPTSRMVVLSGGLGELSAETLLRSLGHRHPDLPVVSIE